jgi:hypothetical protein
MKTEVLKYYSSSISSCQNTSIKCQIDSIDQTFMFFKVMYNGREDMSYFSSPHHLEKTINIRGTMQYILLSPLTINEN